MPGDLSSVVCSSSLISQSGSYSEISRVGRIYCILNGVGKFPAWVFPSNEVEKTNTSKILA